MTEDAGGTGILNAVGAGGGVTKFVVNVALPPANAAYGFGPGGGLGDAFSFCGSPAVRNDSNDAIVERISSSTESALEVFVLCMGCFHGSRLPSTIAPYLWRGVKSFDPLGT